MGVKPCLMSASGVEPRSRRSDPRTAGRLQQGQEPSSNAHPPSTRVNDVIVPMTHVYQFDMYKSVL